MMSFIGIGLNVFGGILISVGVNIQKMYYRNPMKYIWYIGLVGMIVGSICDAYSSQFTSHSILAPISSLSLIFNLGFACYLNQESLSIHILSGTCFIILGSILCVLSAPTINRFSSPDIFLSERYITYNLVLIVSFYSFRWLEYSYPDVFYSFMSGIFGAQNTVYSKIVFDLISTEHFYTRYPFYLSVLSLSISVLIHFYWLGQGLKHYPTLSVIPISKAIGIIYTVLAGIIIYSEYTTLHLFAGFLLGLSIIINGMIFFAIPDE